MIKIALSGKGGVGKNTIASIIAKDYFDLQENDYIIAAFATRIKQIIQSLFPGCSEEALYGASELRQKTITSDLDILLNDDTTYRQVSCDIGKLGRSYNNYIWIAHIAHQLRMASSSKKLFIIADLRFKDEFEWAKANGFLLCRIKRNENLGLNDISETEQDGISDDEFDIIIENDCSMIELVPRISALLDEHGLKLKN